VVDVEGIGSVLDIASWTSPSGGQLPQLQQQ
jgi:hypothetical protein